MHSTSDSTKKQAVSLTTGAPNSETDKILASNAEMLFKLESFQKLRFESGKPNLITPEEAVVGTVLVFCIRLPLCNASLQCLDATH